MIMNKTLTFVTTIAAITLTTGLIAGGNDRDMGPIESLDAITPALAPVVPLVKKTKPKTLDSISPAKFLDKGLDAMVKVKTPVKTPVKASIEIPVKKLVKTSVKKLNTVEPVVPVAKKAAIREQAPDVMMLNDTSDIIGQTPSGFAVTEKAHQNCQETLNLSDNNISKFKGALAVGSLFNTGPIGKQGTLFSPERWVDYFYCVRGQ